MTCAADCRCMCGQMACGCGGRRTTPKNVLTCSLCGGAIAAYIVVTAIGTKVLAKPCALCDARVEK